MSKFSPTLLKLAQHTVWSQARGIEKKSVVPPGMDPMAGGGAPPPPGGAPPMDPMAGGAPPPPGGAPPMDPMAGGMAPPPMDPAMMGAPPAPPAAGGGKPKFDPMMLDYRMYNLQQQMTAIMNAMDISLPPGALVMPPGAQAAPPAESAMPGGPQDPSAMVGPGGGGDSAISPIEPMQAASPELAAGGGGGPMPGGEKLGAADGVEPHDGSARKEVSPPSSALNVPGAPAKTPSSGKGTAGGSKDPKSVTDGPMPKPKTAAQEFIGRMFPDAPKSDSHIGDPVEMPQSPVQGAAAMAALLRSKARAG